MTLAKMDTLRTAISSGTQKPTAWFTTEAITNLYGQLLRPQERIMKPSGTMKGVKGATGFDAYEFNNKPVLSDEKCTSGVLFALNEDYIDFYGLPAHDAKAVAYKSQITGNDYNAPMGLGFAWSDWVKPSNAAGQIGHIYFGGQLVTSNPKRQGKLTGVTGI